ncbi:unnamed protein product [Tetraodon nigroviridis]|uniref:Purple acid phosphatase n=1 Tax=Tetraodon nigroviridis TaxID=99883 RepID=Q4RLR4_TETNG|nr:unnamed protein product [Tetraodon nigroviridis]
MVFVLAACALLSLSPLLVLGVPPTRTQPEQVHLSYPGVPGSMTVTWTTFNKTESRVEYGLLGGRLFEKRAKGESTLFVDSGVEKRKMFIHRVTLTGLRPAATYRDFAYDMHEDNARIGDEFMRQIQSIAAYVPYMTCPGNHEAAYNFSNYRNRFSMPGQTESLWYSWNLGPVHIISLSTEVYFYLVFGLELLFKQYEWLRKDLEEANRPENRALRPWIITMGHRPMYCSDDDQDDCTKFDSYVRLGRNDTRPPAPGLEDLLYRYGVDLELWAHEHTYERLWPVYGDKVWNGSTEQPYVKPRAPVHIITGSAGCREKTDRFTPNPKDWSAFRSRDYGYTRMQVVNATHLYLEQVSDDQYGKVIDSIWVVKEKHGYSAWF